MLEKIVTLLPLQLLRKVEPSFTFHNDCGNDKMQEVSVAGVCYS